MLLSHKNLFLFTLLLTFLGNTTLQAQDRGGIRGTVVDQASGEPLPGVNVIIQNSNRGTNTDAEGAFTFTNVGTGSRTLHFSFIGYKTFVKTVDLAASQTATLAIELSADVMQMSSIQVTSLRPDQISQASLRKSDVQQANPRDSGELLRQVAGVEAVRRGPVGLDPVIRGLRETEVGTYLDGTRIFPGGPARMDSPLSHLDPSAIQSIQVVKGPYALTLGAGNMSTVRVKTQPLTSLHEAFSGTIRSGFDSNFNALEEALSLEGKSGDIGYWVHGAWRKGSNYESGNGTTIPADFLSREVRGKIGYAFTPQSTLSVSLGYQDQQDLDYPGRLLDASYFHTFNAKADWKWNPKNSIFSAVNANFYINNVDHKMNNDEKPTAQSDPDRMPPFALDVGVDARAHVTGGKINTQLTMPKNWGLELGTDFYSANRDAVRTIDRRDEGMKPPAFPLTDLMWPDATITDWGLYGKVDHSLSENLQTSTTLRADFVNADADTISQFFSENVSTNLDATETNFGGSFTLSYLPADYWTLGLGIGSAVRTADATERYSDRVPASKAQTSAEFVGNPTLDPERSTQADIWISADYKRWSLSLNGFVRRISDYITLQPTDLPKRLPLSPNTVYQYINGAADFWGFEIGGSYRLLQPLAFNATFNYLRGQDTELDEPALGVAPFSVDAGLRYESPSAPFFAETTVHFVSEQDRVAITRGETATDGYTTADFLAGITIWRNVYLQAGVKNITNKQYVNHLNAKNPYTAAPIPEPGRIIYGDITIQF